MKKLYRLHRIFFSKGLLVAVIFLITGSFAFSQVPPNINSGNPNFPFPQFLSYNNNTLHTLSHFDHHMDGVPHAEIELRTREAYQILCNNMQYYPGVTVAGVQYIYPVAFNHCACIEADGYYLLAAAYMGDKKTFDGYFMWMHDRSYQNTRRYIDCQMNSPNYMGNPGIGGSGKGYTYPFSVYGGGALDNSATDGDVDVALALLVAWKQWGDNGTICINPCTGQPVTYKQEFISYIKAMVQLNDPPALNNNNYLSGDIGIDGYFKNGDFARELTNWANGTYMGMTMETAGIESLHIDYAAPAYARFLAKF